MATKDPYRVGLLYRSGGQKMTAEAGNVRLGTTTREPKYGDQVYWFKSIGEFEKYRADVFEMKHGHTPPVPVVELLDAPESLNVAEVVKGICDGSRHLLDEEKEALKQWLIGQYPATTEGPWIEDPAFGSSGEEEPVLTRSTPPFPTKVPPYSPPPPPPMLQVQDRERIFAAHAGRRIRLNDFAEELQMDPEALKNIITNDPRYRSPIVAGWVSPASDS